MESEVQADAETGEESDVQIGAETEVLENIRRCLRGTASVSDGIKGYRKPVGIYKEVS